MLNNKIYKLLKLFKKKVEKLIQKNNLINFFYYYFGFYFFKHKEIFENDEINIINTYKWLTCMDKSYCYILSYPSSGMHYTLNVINYYLNKKYYKKDFINTQEEFTESKNFKHRFINSADIFGANQFHAKKLLNFALAFTHSALHTTPYLKQKLVFSDKIIYLIRDPLSTLYSYSKKKNLQKNFDFNDLIEFVEFYNSHSKFILDKKSLLIYSNKLSSNDKYNEYKKIFDYMFKDKPELISDSLIKESIDHFAFEKEIERSDKKFKQDFFMGLKNYENYFSIQEKEMIMKKLKERLKPEIYNIVTKQF